MKLTAIETYMTNNKFLLLRGESYDTIDGKPIDCFGEQYTIEEDWNDKIIIDMEEEVEEVDDFVVFYKKIKKWSKDRHLNDLKYDGANLMNNILEEMQETIEAESEEEIIDGILDELIYFAVDSFKVDSPIDEDLVFRKYYTSRVLVQTMGYDFIECLKEVIREISSRKGSWSAEAGKWVKDATQGVESLYKANFKKWKYIN